MNPFAVNLQDSYLNMDVLMTKVEKAAVKKRAHEEKIIKARIKEITDRKFY